MPIRANLLFLSLFLLFLLWKEVQGTCSSCPSNGCSETGMSQESECEANLACDDSCSCVGRKPQCDESCSRSECKANLACDAYCCVGHEQQCDESCFRYPIHDYHLEAQGIYTGLRIPDKMLVFQISEKSVLMPVTHPDSNETDFVRRKMTVRDTCTVMEKALTPNLSDLLKERGDVCFSATHRGPQEIDSQSTKKYMAVWTFTVPANQCFALQFYMQTSNEIDQPDKLTILDGNTVLPVALKSVRHAPYEILPQNDTSTVSVVYFYTSLSHNVYWRMTPSLRTSDCVC